MPTYAYKCKACEHRFEIIQKITEDSLTTCPECSGEIRRVLFPAGVVFKGSGWYVTDYRNSSEKEKVAADAKEGGSSPAASTDSSKPADGKASEAKPAETKAAESKPTETKSESKTGEAAKAA